MASLTGQLVAETYKALLKLIDNDILTASEKQITDGFGGGSNVFIDSQGFLRANKYKVTNGLVTQFLKADGSLDSNAYLTSITGAQVITALGYTPVPTTRTITINGETHNLAADNSWTVGGTAAIWGNITGTLSNQTDLQNALNAKYNNPTGTISQYIRGDGTLATFPTMPGGLPTGGSAGQILSKIDATDYNAQWIDNYATQTKNEVKLGQTLTKGTPVYVSSANGTNIIVSRASNTSEALSSKTFGLLEIGGATNDIVKCVTFGLIAGLDTSTAQAGDPVWLGVNGALIFGLANKPYAPAHLVYIGVVTRVQQNNGEIFVNIQNGFELKEIHDVYIADPANNHGLFYDIADGLWKNKSIATALGYTPQAQLSGTGFVKASGTTITYDNSTYLTTTDAASTYQRLDKMVSNLLPSATEYPNSNAVIAALALKADAANPVFTGNMTISGAEPKLYFTDTDQNPDYFIGVDAGFFRVYDQTAGATRFVINSDGNISTGVGKSITAGSFIKDGGTATQFLKADGSVDSTDYATVASLANYLLSATAATTYQTLANLSTDLTASATKYPSVNAVNTGLGTKQPLDADLTAIAALTGTSGFLKKTAADTWTLDTSTYLTTGDASTTYLAITTAASTYQRLDKMVSNLLPSSTEYPNSNAVINALALKADAANPVFTGNMTISGATPRLYFVDTDQNPDYTVFIDSGYFYIYDQTAGATRFSINSSGNINTGVGKSIIAGSFIKESGTSSQYLMADGSVSTGPDLSGYLPLTGSTMTGQLVSMYSGAAYAFVHNGGGGITTPQGAFFVNSYPSTADRYYTQYAGNWSSAGTWGLGTRGNGDNTIYIGRQSANGVIDPTDSNIFVKIGPNLVLNAGNYSSYALPLTGGTMTGVINGNGGGNFYMYFYSRIGLPNAGRIIYNNGTGSNMFFGEIQQDVYGFTGNLYSDTPTLAMNVSSKRVGIGFASPNAPLEILSESTSTSNVVRYSYNGTPTGYYLNMGTIVSSGLVKWTYDQVNNGTTYSNVMTFDRGSIIIGGVNSTGKLTIQSAADGNMFSIRGSIAGYGYPNVIEMGVSGADGYLNVKDGAGNIQSVISGYSGTATYFLSNLLVGTSTNSGYKFEVKTSTYNRLVSFFSGSYTSGFKFSDLNGGIKYDAGIDTLELFSDYTNGKLILSTAGTAKLTIATNGASTFIENVTITNVGRPYFIAKTTNSGEEAGMKIQQSTISDWYFGTAQGTSSAQDLAIRDVSNGRIPVYFQQSTGKSIFPYGATVSNTLTFSGGDRALECAVSGGVSFYSNEINSGSQGVTGDLYLGWRRTNYVNVGPPMVLSSTLTAAGIIYANGGINLGSGVVKIRWGGNNTPTLGLPFGGSDTGNSLFIEAADSDTGGIAICNDGVTVYGAADAGFLFRAIDEDSYQSGVGLAAATTFIINQGTSGGGSIKGDFTISGSAYANAFYESSDFRLKTLIENNPIISGIENLEAKLYTKNGKTELGYFAQDAEKLMPYAVEKGADGFLSLSYREIHTAKIARLEQRVAELEKQLNLN